MDAEMIKTILLNAIRKVAEDKEGIVEDAKKMFIRKRKITFETLIQGSIAIEVSGTISSFACPDSVFMSKRDSCSPPRGSSR